MNFFMHRRPFQSMKRFYNWFNNFYGVVENKLGPVIDEVVNRKIKQLPGIKNKTVLEYACGAGLLTLKLAEYFKSIDARDASTGMLERAKTKAKKAGLSINFIEGNILEPTESDKSYDYVFISFALHLFSPQDEIAILNKMIKIAREGVIILDHGRKWNFSVAVVEWLEGSYYDRFIKTDFAEISKKIGVKRFEIEDFNSKGLMDCTYLAFFINP